MYFEKGGGKLDEILISHVSWQALDEVLDEEPWEVEVYFNLYLFSR